MQPTDLGLPDKFTAFRPGQADIALDVAASDHRFELVSSPTGSGKSIIYIAAARLTGRTVIVTATKGLQQQLMADFESMGLVDIRGQNNYRCVAVDAGAEFAGVVPQGSGCDLGPCHVGLTCSLKESGCGYYDQLSRARDADLVVTTYAYWLAMTRRGSEDGRGLGKFDLLVLDEAHAAPDELANFCAVEINHRRIAELLGDEIGLPPDDFPPWAKVALDIALGRSRDCKKSLDSKTSDRRDTVRTMRQLSYLGSQLRELASNSSIATEWIVESNTRVTKFSPIWAQAYAERYLWGGTKRVLLISAVLQERAAWYLGIPAAKMRFREYASTFNPSKRQLVYLPTVRVGRNVTEGEIRLWVNRIDAVIAKHVALGHKGIVHTVSYDRARELVDRSRHPADLFITHKNSTGARTAVAMFKRSQGPRVLVSPSMEAGYDFPGDECRFQVIAKVPFIDTRSEIVQARSDSDKRYLDYVVALRIIQQVGRGVRSEDDECTCYIIDDHWAWFRAKAKDMFPVWFRKAWRQRVSP